ncbi:MAG: hypothetical protein ACRYFZ_19460 [Janthinobacterium lividum]
MRKLLCYALPILLLGSCATTRNLPTAPVPPSFEATPDSLPFVLVTPKATLFDQLRHRTPAPVAYRGLPAKIKNSTITVNYAAGNQTNSTTTTAKNGRTVVGDGASNIEAGKKAGPIIRADTGATVATSQKGPAQAGDGNHQAATKKGPAQAGDGNRATEQKASGWPWWLWLLIVAVVGTAIYRIYKRFTPT